MNPIRILHTADIHFDRENQKPALASLQTVYEHGRDQGVDLWAIAGDLFNRAIQNTESSGFPKLTRLIQAMMNIAPVVAVQGTPTHDILGCYEVLEELNAEYPFVLLDPRKLYYLSSEHGWLEEIEEGDELNEVASLLVFGLPEPSKQWFLAGKEGLGRDEATQAVVQGMRDLLLGWGAVRRQYPDIPCLMVYHGAIEGARLSSNQIQRPGELALGRDDLALVGADYYALGHFHEAQQIENLPAFYAGSARYGDRDPWSESDQKGFNFVTLELNDNGLILHLIDRIPFPHLPPRKKITQPFGQDLNHDKVDGYQVWLETRANKQQAAMIKTESVLTELLSIGALEGSRVTIKIEATETLRAGEIQEAQRLREKVMIWARNSGVEITERILEKADELEQLARTAGITTEPMDIIVNKLLLRGATGILKGRGVDEIILDLDKYDDGLIALTNANGTGKTTLVENLQAFSQMLTRRGVLQDHFRLRDSYRDLYLTDRLSGKRFRSWIQIDGANASGSCDYHLYQDGQPKTNGRKSDYDAQVTSFFGTVDMFKRSAFIGQKTNKQNPALADLTKGEKKELFGGLAGLEPVQFAAGTAGERAKQVEAAISVDEQRIKVLEELLAGSSAKEDDLSGMVMRRDEKQEELEQLETSGKQLRSELELLQQKVEANRRVFERIEAGEKRQAELVHEMSKLAQKAGEYHQAIQQKTDAEAAIQKADGLRAEQGRLNDERSKIHTKREQILAEYNDRNTAVAAEEKKLQTAKAAVDAEIAKIRTEKASFVAKIDQIQAFLQKTVECPNCKHQFVPGGEEQRVELEKLQNQVYGLDKDLVEEGKVVSDFQKQIEVLVYPFPPELPGFGDIDVKLHDIAEELSGLNSWQPILQKAREAEVRLEEMEKRRQQMKGEKDKIIVEIEDLKKQLDDTAGERFERKQAELSNAEEIYRQTRDELKGLEASIAALEKELDELGKKAGELLQIKTAVQEKQQDAGQWRLLERACGPDGIQALELDAMSPEIQEAANKLLSVAREANPETPFDQIRIETTRIGGRGSDKRQIEDFLIWCHDTRDDSWTELSMISGGEDVWIREAIYESFSIRRARAKGLRFSTVVADEADGALDPQARLAYFRMLETAHQESKRRHTIVITQSETAREMIPQQIRLEDLVVQETT